MTDRTTVLAVVFLLGMFLLASLAGLIYLVADGQAADRLAIVAGPMGTALGALAAILVSTRSSPPSEPDVPPNG